VSQGNFLTKALASGVGRVLDRVRQMRHPGQNNLFASLLKRTRFDYASEVGDGLDASVVTATVMWVQRALPEATLAMRERKSGGAYDRVEDHDLLKLMANPNPAYSDILMLEAIVLSLLLAGNAYLVKVRNAVGKPVELWFVPPQLIEPYTSIDGSTFVEYYRYVPGTGAGVEYYAPEDVIHIRHTLNPRNLILGLSPLHGVLREIFTDLETSNFIASLLRNMGVPGTIISPKGSVMPTADDVAATKTWFQQSYSGDGRGKAMVFGGPMEVSSFGFNPEQMNLSHGSNRAEERVTACIGIPAAVVGFGAGLDQTKVGATMTELRKLAWHNGVLPLARKIIDELQRSLLPDFQRVPSQRGRQLELYWDTDHVLALQEDEDKKSARKLKEFEAGAITLAEYREETGRDVDDSHRFYLRRPNQVIEPEGEALKLAEERRGQAQALLAAPEGDAKQPEEPETEEQGSKAAKPVIETKSSDLPHDYLPPDAAPAKEPAIKRGAEFVGRLERAEPAQFAAFEEAVTPVFEGWGDEGGRIAQAVLLANGEKSVAGNGLPIETKASDADLVQQIIDLLNFEAWDRQLSARYQAQYLQIAREVAEGIEASGYGTQLPDPIMREVIAEGGTRAGLIDLDEQTRTAIFKALAEGRAEGEGVEALANRIANRIEGGRFDNAKTRAKLIARIETKHAQNVSTIRNGAANGFTRFIVYDGRLGPGRSEPSHIERSGMIVSTQGALEMTAAMRPNCTLSFAPYIDL
jgi:HK97 family phage portal protein